MKPIYNVFFAAIILLALFFGAGKIRNYLQNSVQEASITELEEVEATDDDDDKQQDSMTHAARVLLPKRV